ncbi:MULTISPECIES: universal stress protein [Cupriavidus]|uniref:Universal stress protein n=1 Tax=Cupriavidus pinatubonensis (strain JMP 134 / LMG 1197) TaxID=264198 RepID=Q472U9_CUPPJ|nr:MULTISPECIES: universal stress protein [Cupriavidus]TPQ29783.1 universal stress protein [Cupriavidus pinatubonensis]
MYKKILVAVDGSHCSDLALDHAIGLAALCDADLQVVHVIDNGYLKYDMGYVDLTDLRAGLIKGGEELLAQAQEKAKARHVRCQTVMIDEIVALGDIAHQIRQLVESSAAELVVLGTHGRHGVSRLLLGSVAESLARQCPVPVLLVRAKDAT